MHVWPDYIACGTRVISLFFTCLMWYPEPVGCNADPSTWLQNVIPLYEIDSSKANHKVISLKVCLFGLARKLHSRIEAILCMKT